MYIESTMIEQWANTDEEAAFKLPRLIRRLIWATCPDVKLLEMPSEKDVYFQGFDGRVHCEKGNQFVPAGFSVWELSVDKDVAAKANDDYRKRSQNSQGVDKKTAAFVFATARHWHKREKWTNGKNEDNTWREVRGLSSQNLADWMDRVPWITADFTRCELGRSLSAFRSINMIWDDYANVLRNDVRPLSTEYILGGRSQAQIELMRWLEKPSDTHGVIRIEGPSEKEALHFIAASLHPPSCIDSDSYEARVIVLDKPESAIELRSISSHHVIIVNRLALTAAITIRRQTHCKIIVYLMRQLIVCHILKKQLQLSLFHQ